MGEWVIEMDQPKRLAGRNDAKSDPMEVIPVSAVDGDREPATTHLAQLAFPVQTV